MPTWEVLSTEKEPEIFIHGWAVYEFEMNEENVRLLFGAIPDGTGRRSTAIKEYNSEHRYIITASGRRYNLIGFSNCVGSNTQYMINNLLSSPNKKNISWRDVSSEYD